jgi:hypothetical protein
MTRIALGGTGISSSDIAKALGDLPRVHELGYNHKSEAKKKKNRLRELARRQKRLDKLSQK